MKKGAQFDVRNAVPRTPPPRSALSRIGGLFYACAMIIVGLIFYAIVVGAVFLTIIFALEFATSGTLNTRMLRAFVDLLPII